MNVVYIGLGILFFLLISSKLHSRKKRRNKVIHVVESNCTGCQRCVKRCSRHVLEIISNEKGTRVVVKNPDRCTACGDCIGKCKFKALEIVERN
ncbi:Electron transport complex subunit RsxB [termite gut metagenome]|uniref:Electron transport complex subunit RsxB n=1 Tax=termite gut metagenome TaxID=433724 RepID=A0A5J4S386_9ZZZZ